MCKVALPRYHIHVTEYTGAVSEPQLPLDLFKHPVRLSEPQVPSTEKDNFDSRLGHVEVHFISPTPHVDRAMLHSAPDNTARGRFIEQDSFLVEPQDGCAHDARVKDQVRVAFGIVHLFRSIEGDAHRGECDVDAAKESENTDAIGTVLCMLSVPFSMTVTSLLDFIEPALGAIQHIRLVRQIEEERCLVLVKFRETLDAEEFYKMYNGQPYSELDLFETCQLVYVTGVTASPASSIAHAYPLLSDTEPWPVIGAKEVANDPQLHALSPFEHGAGLRRAAYELPTCPVCLERLDSSLSGLVTVACQHAFHTACLHRWSDSRCPVCRYTTGVTESGPQASLKSAHPTCCRVCETRSNVWLCLICANVGCGRYKAGHAQAHFKETGHLYSLELETQRVWDYAGDGYVHRLIQGKADGKLVELPSASSVPAATPNRAWNERYPGFSESASRSLSLEQLNHTGNMDVLNEKMGAIGLEYSNMIVSQLDSQRIYYEGLLAATRAERVPREEKDKWRTETEAARAQCTALEAEMTRCRSDQHKHETQLRRALESMRTLRKQYDDEKSVSDGLYQHVQKLQAEQASLKSKVQELGEELRDMMFFVSARDKIEDLDQGAAPESGKGGDAFIPPPKPAKGKKRT
ncbi:RING-type E3 ubiquitin transferase [Malassezia vespertilionis]|uniref:RING-type E3 ubiquitin transferase n=1 Tax=Malassezia vespertilionis TaxID=2020962 RepID=UPI0024B14945|nr:RING-type E3 ubiquitin transferase [Malassezia vespertilionis]WFD05819.1 RING-type E3 ubiquitin transferase [Malassezia vespertilionis]